MSAIGFTVFDTAIGCCGIAWSGRGIVGVALPQGSRRAMMGYLQRRFPGVGATEPPPAVKAVIADIVALISGEPRELRHVVLDAEGVPDFHRRVYEVARTIAPGAVLSYGEIAERLGDRTLARDVGQALGQNPFPIIVPCHRVLGADGKVGGFSAPGGRRTKLRLLSIERARRGEPLLFDDLPWMEKPRRRA
jgi:methylated-DNA-[protein]-cysteine S-methyltransferase